MKKLIVIRILSFAAVVAVMAVIFMFSAQSAARSDETSGGFIEAVAKLLKPDFEQLTAEEQEQLVQGLQGITRTAAHFAIFAALGFFAANSLLTFTFSRTKRFLIALGFSFLYALSDEVHQYFVPGRAFQLSDLAVDTLGAAFGISALLLLAFVCKKTAAKRKLKKDS